MVVGLLVGLGAGGGVAADVPPPRLTYHLALDPDLASARVRVCFEGFLPRLLVVDHERGLAPLRLPREVRRDEKARGVTVGDLPEGCFEYVVDFAAMGRDDDARDAYPVGADLVTLPTRWLLRPARAPKGTQVTLTLSLPEGIVASVPWERLPEPGPPSAPPRYRLDETVWRFEGRVAFGRFRPERLEVGGAAFEIAVLDRPHRASPAGIRRWIHEAARAVSCLHGRFPVPRVQVLVEPTPGRGAPVVFGTSRQGGGGGVLLLLAQGASDEDLPGEWVAVHELAHLAMPPVAEADAWFSEGITTYYQEVLRARAGLRSGEEAWQEIHAGFLRGTRRPVTATLAEDSASMHRTHRYHRVYWSGTALALRFDVEVRRRSGGRSSLDDLLRRWVAEPGARSRRWTAEEACRALDRLAGTPVFGPVAAAALGASAFPRFDDLYADLGVRVIDGAVTLREDAPGAALRRAILAPPAR